MHIINAIYYYYFYSDVYIRLETSTLGSSPSPRKPLLDVNTPSTPKENFPIFNVFQTPASIKSTAKEVNKDSPTSIVSTLSTNSSAISKKQSQVISSSSPSSKLAERIKQQLSEKSSKPRFPYQAPDRPMLTSEKLQQGSGKWDQISFLFVWRGNTYRNGNRNPP